MKLTLANKRKPLAVDIRKPNPQLVVINGIDNQLGLLADPAFKVNRYRYIDIDDGTGALVRRKRMVASPPRKWWFFDEDDALYYLQLRYGSSYILSIQEGMPSIKCGKMESDVIKVLNHVKTMVISGELDEQINALKEKSRRR